MSTSERLDALIDQMTSGITYVSSEVARDVIDAEPALVKRWLVEHQHAILTQYVGLRSRSVRRATISQRKAGVFADQAEEFEAGNVEALGSFMQIHYHVDKGEKPLGEMTHDDLLYTAERYQQHGKRELFEAAWLTAIAKRVKPDQTVGEAWTDDQLRAMRKRMGE